MKCIRVGLAGYGFGGRVFHAPAISAVEGLEPAAIVQRSGDTAAAAYPHATIHRSLDALLADESIRLIVIATPTNTHARLVRQCLLADRDVVVDKPFTVTAEEAAELIPLARERRRLLSIFQNRRWDGDFLTVRKMLDGDRLGRLVQFESHYDRYRLAPRLQSWREDGSAGGGVLLDLGAHLADQALALFGVPNSIWASVRLEREGARSNDAFDICLRYAAPLSPVVWLRATCLARDPRPRFHLHGTLGAYRKSGMDPQEARLLSGDLYLSHPWGVENQEQWGTLVLDEAGAPVGTPVPTEPGDYRAYYRNIRDVLHGREALEVTPVQAWRTMRVLQMARESSRTGCEIKCDWSREP